MAIIFEICFFFFQDGDMAFEAKDFLVEQVCFNNICGETLSGFGYFLPVNDNVLPYCGM